MNLRLIQTFTKGNLNLTSKWPRSSKRGKPFHDEIFGNNEEYSPLPCGLGKTEAKCRLFFKTCIYAHADGGHVACMTISEPLYYGA